eukprot:1605368-Rhodomonas_salina.2
MNGIQRKQRKREWEKGRKERRGGMSGLARSLCMMIMKAVQVLIRLTATKQHQTNTRHDEQGRARNSRDGDQFTDTNSLPRVMEQRKGEKEKEMVFCSDL